MRCALFALGVGVMMFAWIGAATAEEDHSIMYWDELKQGFSLDASVLAFATQQNVAEESLLNPQNQLAPLPTSQFDLQLRPDLRLDFRLLRIKAKPRLHLNRSWPEGVGEGDSEGTREAFFNEWLVQFGYQETFFGSYGREVLLWGPAMFLSPSNPFFFDNGRSNPYRELGGTDFLQLAYIPGSRWSLFYIRNTERGRGEERRVDFKPIDAVKVDFTQEASAFSVIASKRRGDRLRLGGYGQVTASDALLFYGETVLGLGGEGLYPRRVSNPVGWEMRPEKTDSDKIFHTTLIGGAYTFEAGPTLTLEYVHNREGYDDREAQAHHALGREVSPVFLAGTPASPLAASVLSRAIDPNLRLLRRNYLFMQVLQNDIARVLDLNFRYTHNLDDGSGFFVFLASRDIGDRSQLFGLAAINKGDPESEFGQILDVQAILGIKVIIQ
jgi:hypothetical protein